ncbi:MAG: hypothetical protein WBI82_14940 [Sphaerochaeta sp.]
MLQVEGFHLYLDRTFGDDGNQTTNRKASCNLGIMKKFVFSLYTLAKAVEGKKTLSSVQQGSLFDYEDTLMRILSICDMSTSGKPSAIVRNNRGSLPPSLGGNATETLAHIPKSGCTSLRKLHAFGVIANGKT